MDYSDAFFVPAGITYFDSAASSLTAKAVLQEMDAYYRQKRANIHRGAHRLTRSASEAYEAVYGKMAQFFHASEQEFTAVRNATEALNAVALGLDWNAGDEVIVTDVEHHSNFLPWLRLKQKGVRVKILEGDADGRLSPDALSIHLTNKTRLVAFTACSNVLGARVPVKELAKTAHDAGAQVALDAAQYVGHHPMDLKSLPIDFMAFSGHKAFGPTGIGALFHREGSGLTPWFVGGGTVRIPQDSADWPKEWKTVYYKNYPRFPKIQLQREKPQADFFTLIESRRSKSDLTEASTDLSKLSTLLQYS
ncbi:MAG: aminotransferase class V-fold PLP-dependent enzyme [Candidatus Micrarchaeota archaeon]|nr:aminotransferase class V-fold PLP-dependent enzyme [Candidatus Micrarchaeota archaeon]